MRPPPPTAWRRASSLSLTEASAVLGCSPTQARRLADRGVIPTFRDGFGRRRVRPADLEPLVDGSEPDLFGGAES